jgi:hypothetical protein
MRWPVIQKKKNERKRKEKKKKEERRKLGLTFKGRRYIFKKK